MSRRSHRGDESAPAMFPFLAVLLCTIGALVLVLVISVVNSHASAKRDLSEELQEKIEKKKEESDFLQTISEELAARREKVRKEIERRQKELANVEDHIQRLEAQMIQLRAQADLLESPPDQDSSPASARTSKIEELRGKIEAAQKRLEEELENGKQRKLAFSIIPYDGPNGTSRRPVYLECNADGVVIQPEGIRISAKDLRPPYGPGNPLDAALRVLRTAYQQRDRTFGLTIPPYPLLIVRPDGIHSYAMARAAMSGWDDQFGYELVDADMPLAFPPGIPNLAEELIATIDTARKRQDSLVAALPRQIARARELDEIDLQSLTPEGYGQQSDVTGTVTAADEDSNPWRMIDEYQGSTDMASGQPRNPSIDPAATGSSMERMLGVESSDKMGSSYAEGTAGTESSGGATSAPSGQEIAASKGTPNRTSDDHSRANAFSSGSATGMNSQSASSSQGASTPDSEAMANAIQEMQRKESESKDLMVSAPKNTKNPATSQDDSAASIASTRGKGWASSRQDSKATPVTRPIRIVALQDRWLLRKEGSDSQFDLEIELAPGPQHASASLEKAIRNRVDSWGLSLPGGYWSPSITIESASDATLSVHRLQRFLDGSGVEVSVVPLQAPAANAAPASNKATRR